jgi:hypothetical protein
MVISVKTEVATPKPNLLPLGLFLVGTVLGSVLIPFANTAGFVHVLGWSMNPGWSILFLLFVLALFVWFRRESLLTLAIASLLFVLPIYLDAICRVVRPFANIFPLSSAAWLLLVFLPILVGCCYVYRMKLPLYGKLGYLMVGAYIGSVHIYNMWNPGQFMGFFGGGWIA